jgi:hypothetical protein
VEDIVATWKTAYGTERVQKWIDDFEKARLASFDQGS